MVHHPMDDCTPMRTSAYFLLIAFCLATRLSAGDEHVEEHRFVSKPGGTVRLTTFAGGIRVTPSGADEVRVVIHKTPNSAKPDAARRWLEQVEVAAHQSGESVNVEVRDRRPAVRLTLADRVEGHLRFEVYVPRRCHLHLETRQGQIDVGPELMGNVRARVESGSVVLGRIDGDVDVRLETGELQLSRATGNATLRVARGDLTVGTVFGRAVLRSGSGGIEILNARGGLDASATAGDVEAGFPRTLSAASNISASGGSITVTLDPAVDLEIEASSVWGRVSARDLPLTPRAGGNGRRRLVGALNAGGPLLKLRANGGHVRIEAQPDLIAGF